VSPLGEVAFYTTYKGGNSVVCGGPGIVLAFLCAGRYTLSRKRHVSPILCAVDPPLQFNRSLMTTVFV
jgi:hypothetical protein